MKKAGPSPARTRSPRTLCEMSAAAASATEWDDVHIMQALRGVEKGRSSCRGGAGGGAGGSADGSAGGGAGGSAGGGAGGGAGGRSS